MENKFLRGCLAQQRNSPQLTNKQWIIIKEMKKRYGKKDAETSPENIKSMDDAAAIGEDE